MLTLTQKLSTAPKATASLVLSLTSEERTRSRHLFHTPDGISVYLYLPRGTVLQDGDFLTDETGQQIVRIVAQPEPVLTVKAEHWVDLLRAAYHLGNRHVPLEITANSLHLATDPVLQSMLQQLGVQVVEELVPFQPETGAYRQNHSHSHSHSHSSASR
ncbi:MAG: urease accessory protein UreE [Scytolyngbya sp. HA4215-MV1]|jgi:urease accessory protein|nr:urease accessory protein UreE [Scytolyngbya sp. HA4215-MV1]